MPRYGESAKKSVERAMRKRKHGTLRSGRSHKRVTDRSQAIAIGLEEAREAGGKVPPRNGRGRRRTSARAGNTGRTRTARSHTGSRRSGV